jgi:hypothetical protein
MILHQFGIRDQLDHHIFFRNGFYRREQFHVKDRFVVILEEIGLAGIEVNVQIQDFKQFVHRGFGGGRSGAIDKCFLPVFVSCYYYDIIWKIWGYRVFGQE